MRRYSAVEAIGPAWERTREILVLRPIGQFIKLLFIALLAEVGGLLALPNVNFATHAHNTPAAVKAFVLAFSLVFAFIFFIAYAVIFYFGSRLQFVFVDIVLTRQKLIAPLWSRHRSAVWRWMLLKLAPSLFVYGAIIALSATLVARLAMIPPHTPGMPTSPQAVLSVFAGLFSFMALVFLASSIGLLIYSQMRDFVLPSFVLEDASIDTALQRWGALWSTDTAAMFGYLFFRTLLAIVTYIATNIALILLWIIGAIPFGLVLLAFHAGHRSVGSIVTLIALGTVTAIVLIVWAIAVALTIMGFVYTFFQAYSLYFLGGRYPLLGDILEPAVAAPWTPPPSFPSKGEDDQDSGPSFPMNPIPVS